jgi:ABC-type uncharacterized transport system involved in gliding motility auxiliary subunit
MGAVAMTGSEDLTAVQRRYLSFGGRALLISAAAVILLFIANWLAVRNPVQWDWTENQVLSLASETLLVLEQLESPVELIGFFPQELASYRENDVRPLLHQYFIESQGGVTYEFIDPQENPAAALQYGQPPAASGAWLVVVYQEDFEVVAVPNEIEITGAIVRLLDPRQRVVYVMSGHGEAALLQGPNLSYQRLSQALIRKRYQIRELNLLADPQIPSDAQLILIIDPRQNLTDNEIELLDEHLSTGGGLVVALEPSLIIGNDSETDRLRSYLRDRWGLLVHDDLVYEADLIPPLTAQGASFASHEITLGLQNSTTLHPTSSSIGSTGEDVEDLDRYALVGTGEQAWGETGLEILEPDPEGAVSFDPESDFPGPVVLAAALQENSSFSRIVVFADAEFASDDYFDEFANSNLILNAIDWTAHHTGLIGLTPNPVVARFILPPSQSRINAMFAGVVVFIPGAVVLAGLLVWWLRRRRL